MKRILFSIVLVLTMVACERSEDFSASGSPFNGKSLTGRPIVQIQHDLHEEGVEASIDSLTYFDVWHWNSQGQLASVDYDTAGIQRNALYTPFRDTYHYDGQGRLESIDYYGYTNRTCRFNYNNGLLSQITYPFGDSGYQYQTEFCYHSGSHYPYAVIFIHPQESFMVDRLGDTLVQTWTLEWSGGNLVRATADSMAWYCTGISWIDYYYDNHPNSLQGLFFASQIFDGSFVDEPTSLCRNNLVRRVIHCTNHDEISSIESLWKYTYGPDGYPTSVSYSYSTMYWTTIYVTNHITYGVF